MPICSTYPPCTAFVQLRQVAHEFKPAWHAAGDWLQGPFVYALYQHYNFDRAAIGQLFIAGFGSSMIIGTLVGSLADRK